MASNNNYALSFNGTTSFVNIPNNPSYNFTNKITLEAWVKTTSTALMSVFDRDNESARQFQVRINGGKIDVIFWTSAIASVGGTKLVNDGIFHHIAIVYDGTNMLIYVDGLLDIQKPLTGNLAVSSLPFAIGKHQGGSGSQFFNGTIDEVRIWNVSKTATEISNIKNKTIYIVTDASGLIGYWRFEAGSGTNLVDASSVGNSAVATNTIWVTAEVDLITSEKFLVAASGIYQRYVNGTWETVTTTTPTENDYINSGMSDISIIPSTAWAQLVGNVELSFYTDDLNKSEVLFNIETNSFYLIDELDGQTVSVIEYTDNPTQTKSTATLELAEPIMLADELGSGSVDVLYYTDNAAYTAADLEVMANYNPIDELVDPSLLVWTDDATATAKTANVTALPRPKLIKRTQDIGTYDRLLSVAATITKSGYGNIEMLVSGNSGTTWYGMIQHNDSTFKLIPVNTDLMDKVKKYSISASDMGLINEADWKAISVNGRFRFAYYIEQYSISDIAKIDKLVMTESAVLSTPTANTFNIVYDAIDSRYYGLLFMDTAQNYYSTSVGEILKYLDMGSLVAGQTSLEATVVLMNTLNYDVKNLQLWVSENIDGVTVDISETSPMNPVPQITRATFASGETMTFYVRISTIRSAQHGGNFDILVKADPA